MERNKQLYASDEHMVIDEICIRVCNWRRFARSIGIEEVYLENICENYRDKYERVYQSICHKKQSSEEVAWSFWRSTLLLIGEGSIVDIIELTYPYLCLTSREDIHVCEDKEEHLTIMSHHADRKDNFLLLPYDVKAKIPLYFGNGVSKWSRVRKREDIHEVLFEKNEALLEVRKYNFSSKGNVECAVLRTLHEWLESNNDGGFAIKGYDVKQHLKHFTRDYSNENPYNDSYVLVYSLKYNLILHIDTNPTDLNEAIRRNVANIRYLRTMHHCLIGYTFHYCPITLYENDTNIESICAKCKGDGLISLKSNFENLSLVQTWWKRTKEENNNIKENQSNQNENIMNDLIKSIIGFMIGITSFKGLHTNNHPRFHLPTKNNIENLTMVHPEQLLLYPFYNQ